MKAAIRKLVRRRARNRCEYCHLPQQYATLVRFHVEHIQPRQHGGDHATDNLCFSCARCNFSKGPNLTGIDPQTNRIARIFHPRRQNWWRHFRWDAEVLLGSTRVGRATIAVLNINHPQRVEMRLHLLEDGTVL